jgi:hypothetical protein
MTTPIDVALRDLRTMAATITSGALSTEELAAQARMLAERISAADRLLTTGRAVLTLSQAWSLGQIIDAASRSAPVARVHDDHPDGVIYGIARHVVVDEHAAAFPSAGNDIRDCLLRVTTRSGFDAFWPLSELIGELQLRTFVLDYTP